MASLHVTYRHCWHALTNADHVVRRAWQQWRQYAVSSAEKQNKLQRAALLSFGSATRRAWAGWRLRVAARRRKSAASELAKVCGFRQNIAAFTACKGMWGPPKHRSLTACKGVV